MGLEDLFNAVGDTVEEGFDAAKEFVGSTVDQGAHLLGNVLDTVGLHDAADAVDDVGDSVADHLGAAVGEQQLGDTEDPAELVHGDVAAIDDSAQHLGKFAAAFGKTADGLAAVDSAHWTGEAAEAFRAKYQQHPRQWADARQACDAACTALSGYGRTVRWAQDQARQAIELYRAGKQASDQARQNYQNQIDAYNANADRYNATLAAGQDPGEKPAQPAAFTDPGQDRMRQAQQLLTRARQQRNTAAEQAQRAVAAATGKAPAEPSFAERMFDDGLDVLHGVGIGAEHFLGGVVKGVGGIAKFARSLNPFDPYNLTHPAAYVDGMSTTAAGLVHAANHPTELLKSLVGSGWGTDPFEAAGKLVPNIALAVGTDGAGTAADAAMSVGERTALGIGEDAAERGAIGIGEDAGERGALGNAERSATRDGVDDPRDPARDESCKSCDGEPVDTATGSLLLTQNDVTLAGALALTVDRHHCTSYSAGRWFGPTWTSTVDVRLEVDTEGVVFAGADGVILFYPHVSAGETVLPAEGARRPLRRATDGGYLLDDPATGHRLYFAPGDSRLLPVAALSDRNGNRITFHYDAHGAPTEIRHSGGYRVLVSTQDGRVTSLGLADGDSVTELTRYGYTAGHLTEVIDSSGQALRFGYNTAGWITGWTDRNATTYHYTYDDAGRCVYETGPDGILEYRFDYAEADEPGGLRVTTATDSLGAQTAYHINDARQVVSIVDAHGGVTRQQWDRYDRLLARTDPAGQVSRYTYDEAGNLLAMTRPDGSQSIAEYNDLGQPTVVVDPDGGIWRQRYDERGNRTEITDPSGATTRCGYDGHGNLVSIVDPLGHRRTMACDDAGLPVELVDEVGGRTVYTRDGFGRVVSYTDPLGGATELSWDVAGRLVGRVLPDGTRESWSYDGEGNLTEHRAPTGAVTHTEYTHFDLPAARTDAAGFRTEYGYDTELRLVSVRNPQGLRWSYRYDEVGRLVAETDFNGRELRYDYDVAGRLVRRVNGAGQSVRYEHDALGNVVRQFAADPGGPAAVTTFEHDPLGRLLHAVGPGVQLTYRRDPLGRVLAEMVNGREVRSAYDAAGRRIARRTPSGMLSEWAYDAAGQAVQLRSNGRLVRFERDAAGREVRRLLGAQTVLAQDWDANHRLTGQLLSTAAGLPPGIGPAGIEPAGTTPDAGLPVPQTAPEQRVLQQRAYTYRPDGCLSGVDDRLTGGRRFDVDRLGRVRAVHGAGWLERYSYDQAGNITGAQWPARPHSGEPLGEREYAGTLIRRAGNVRYTHDAQGRIILRQRSRLSRKPETWHYTWDADDRLVAVRTPDGAWWRYSYDPLGRRIAKLRLGPDGTVLERMDFVWDATMLAEQRASDPGTGNVHHTSWDYDTSQAPVGQSERVEWRDAPQSWVDERFFGIVTDLVGTPCELVGEDGSLAWFAVRTLWGRTSYRSAGADTPLRFPGQYFDAETGLHYNYLRYYDPETGRYASTDPLGLLPAPNPNTYVTNPHTETDPLGLAPCKIRTSVAYQDWGTKGAHLHIDGKEVRIYPDGQGGIGAEGIRLSNGTPTAKQVQDVVDALRSDPSLRADVIQKARSAMNDMNHGHYGMAENRAVEIHFLIKALEKLN